MRKITFYCDRCGKELTGTIYQLATIYFEASNPDVSECDYGADLCEACYRAVDNAVLTEIQTGKQLQQIEEAKAKKAKEKIAPKVKKNKTRYDIDLGKVGALRDAGWSWEKIGEEFHCSAQTIINHVNAHKKLQEVKEDV